MESRYVGLFVFQFSAHYKSKALGKWIKGNLENTIGEHGSLHKLAGWKWCKFFLLIFFSHLGLCQQ